MTSWPRRQHARFQSAEIAARSAESGGAGPGDELHRESRGQSRAGCGWRRPPPALPAEWARVHQGRCSPRSTTMSPRSAEMGTKLTRAACQARSEVQHLVADGAGTRLVVVHQVHLVDRHDDLGQAEQRRRGKCAGATAAAVPCGRRSGPPPPRAVLAPVTMLRVYCSWPGRVGDDELAPRRGEVAIGHVDGDALLALGLQAVGEQGEVDDFLARGAARRARPLRTGLPGWRGCRAAADRSACSCRRPRCRR